VVLRADVVYTSFKRLSGVDNMESKVKTTIKIGNKEYTIRGFESEEYIHRVAIYVDRKMKEIEKLQPNLNANMLNVLTSMNISDEVMKLRDELSELEAENQRLKLENLKLERLLNQSTLIK
jgi:cell division protein ZapA